MLIGILSFQGNYALHKKVLDLLDVHSIYVNSNDLLNKTDALIIPGGESTVISQFILENNMYHNIVKYASSKSVYGTCAGLIIMSSSSNDKKITNLGLININSHRNAWGRQIDSFEKEILLFDYKKKCKASFIRAPKIKINSSNVKILGSVKGEPVLVRNERHLASTFHPEVFLDTSVHQYFINMVKEYAS